MYGSQGNQSTVMNMRYASEWNDESINSNIEKRSYNEWNAKLFTRKTHVALNSDNEDYMTSTH